MKEIIGAVFGELKVVSYSHKEIGSGKSIYNCKCSCGKEKKVAIGGLNSGNNTSCGDAAKHRSGKNNSCFKHGQASSKVYSAWCDMKKRCTNKNNKSYPKYGGSGISISPELLNFTAFAAELGPVPDTTLNYSVDRINNLRGYEIGNIRWSTKMGQSRNRSLFITNKTGHAGVTIAEKGGNFRYVAKWTDSVTLSRKVKAFSFNKYGVIQAQYLANCTRRNEIWFTTMLGGKYGATHGKERVV